MSFRRVNLSSPNNERVRKLSDRLKSIQSTLDSERDTRVQLLDAKFTALESQLEEFAQQTADKLNTIRESVVSIQKRLQNDVMSGESTVNARMNELENMEIEMHSAIEQDLDLRRDAELRTLKVLDERTAAIRMEIAKESKVKNESLHAISMTLSSAVERNKEGCKAAVSEFAVFNSGLRTSLEEFCKSALTELSTERQSREDTEEAMLAMLKDVIGRIKNDLETERRDRESTEDSLLSLLEEACAKLNGIMQGR